MSKDQEPSKRNIDNSGTYIQGNYYNFVISLFPSSLRNWLGLNQEKQDQLIRKKLLKAVRREITKRLQDNLQYDHLKTQQPALVIAFPILKPQRLPGVKPDKTWRHN